MGKSEQIDVNLFCLVAIDFYRHQIDEELDRRAFQSIFEVVSSPGNPYHRLLTCLQSVHKITPCWKRAEQVRKRTGKLNVCLCLTQRRPQPNLCLVLFNFPNQNCSIRNRYETRAAGPVTSSTVFVKGKKMTPRKDTDKISMQSKVPILALFVYC